MKYLSLQPFVPSGSNFASSKLLFQELGFKIRWDSGEYVGFENESCRFILQNYDDKEFAENFMLSVGIENADEFWKYIIEKKLVERFGIKTGPPTQEPYGKEVNIIDIAGVCWHFVEQE